MWTQKQALSSQVREDLFLQRGAGLQAACRPEAAQSSFHWLDSVSIALSRASVQRLLEPAGGGSVC